MANVARYADNYCLAGCYMPDSHDGAHEFTTRRELASFIRSELETYGMPKHMFNAVNIRKLWGWIKRNGSSVAHFSLIHGGYSLAFHGLTEDEFKIFESENE